MDMDKAYKGIYQIIDQGNPEVVYSTHEVSSKEEFDTLLKEVVKYNNASDNRKQLIKI